MNATDSLEASIGAALFLGQPLAIAQWHLHLYTAAPTDDGLGGTEVTGTGYAPVRCDPGAARWAKDVAQVNGYTVFRNLAPVEYPTATAPWGTVVAVVLKDQDGAIRFVNTLTTPKLVAQGNVPVFLAGELEFHIG
jgi:hypothetical protein